MGFIIFSIIILLLDFSCNIYLKIWKNIICGLTTRLDSAWSCDGSSFSPAPGNYQISTCQNFSVSKFSSFCSVLFQFVRWIFKTFEYLTTYHSFKVRRNKNHFIVFHKHNFPMFYNIYKPKNPTFSAIFQCLIVLE